VSTDHWPYLTDLSIGSQPATPVCISFPCSDHRPGRASSACIAGRGGGRRPGHCSRTPHNNDAKKATDAYAEAARVCGVWPAASGGSLVRLCTRCTPNITVYALCFSGACVRVCVCRLSAVCCACGARGATLWTVPHREGKYTRGGRVFCIIRICIVFCILYCICIFWRRPPVTVAAAASRKRDGASCLGCTLGTWLCSISYSIIYLVSCYRFVSQHTYIYHIGPHAHVDTDSRQQQQPPAPAVAQIIQNNTKSSLLYYVLYVLIVLCIVLCIMYFRSLVPQCARARARETLCSMREKVRSDNDSPLILTVKDETWPGDQQQ
jgi:hypothetical protein